MDLLKTKNLTRLNYITLKSAHVYYSFICSIIHLFAYSFTEHYVRHTEH
jgi:hypothetical protein